jgi:hypothetical protein
VYVKKGTKPMNEQKSIHLNNKSINERNPYVKSQVPSKGAFLEKIAAAEDCKKRADEKGTE